MNLSELEGKEIINIYDGNRVGMIAGSDLIFNPRTGELESILIPQYNGILSMFSSEKYLSIPWDSVIKIGEQVIIVDLNSDNYEQYFTQFEY